jgi:hypothetical protein
MRRKSFLFLTIWLFFQSVSVLWADSLRAIRISGSAEDFLKEYHFVSESGDRMPPKETAAGSDTFQTSESILEEMRELRTFNDILETAHRKEMEATLDWYKVSPRERAIAHHQKLAEERLEKERREEEEGFARFRISNREKAIARHKKADEERLAKQQKAKTEAAEAQKYSGSGGRGSSAQPPDGDDKDKKAEKEISDNDKNSGKEWKSKIHGKPQKTGTPGHDWQSMKEAVKATKDPGVAKVYMDKSLSKVTGGKVTSRMRPDVIAFSLWIYHSDSLIYVSFREM